MVLGHREANLLVEVVLVKIVIVGGVGSLIVRVAQACRLVPPVSIVEREVAVVVDFLLVFLFI